MLLGGLVREEEAVECSLDGGGRARISCCFWLIRHYVPVVELRQQIIIFFVLLGTSRWLHSTKPPAHRWW